MAENSNTDWKIPDDFRFKRPLEVVEQLVEVMREKSTENFEGNSSGRVELNNNLFLPLQKKYDWNYWEASDGKDEHQFWYFMKNRVFEIASCYCDPEKAFDFENYPEPPVWTPERLKARMGTDYMEFDHFVSKEKWLIFLYKVLNLCSVRRVAITDYYRSGLIRRYSGYGSQEEAIEVIKKYPWEFFYAKGHGIWISRDRNNAYVQHRARFELLKDTLRPCDVTFYAYASTEGVNEFSSFGTPAKANKWFSAGKADIEESREGRVYYVRELDFPDTMLQNIGSIPEGKEYRAKGFAYKTWMMKNDPSTYYAYAVTDQRPYLKYYDRSVDNIYR